MGEGQTLWALFFSLCLHGGVLLTLLGGGGGGATAVLAPNSINASIVIEAETELATTASSSAAEPVQVESANAPAQAPEPTRAKAPEPQRQTRVPQIAPATGVANAAPGGSSIDGDFLPTALLELTKPAYPDFARRHGQEGRVVFELTIGPTGSAAEITMIKSSGYRLLDQAALQALENARFSPAALAGIPFKSRKRVAFAFDLTGD